MNKHIKTLKRLPRTVYPHIWYTLNGWDWPRDLGDIPTGWEEMSMDERSVIVRPINEWIEKKIGKKECLRYLHRQLGSTNDKFENWWAANQILYKEWDYGCRKSSKALNYAVPALIGFLLSLVLRYLLY